MSKKRIDKPQPSGHGTESVAPVPPTGYAEFLVELKTRVRSAQLKAAVAVNSEMIRLYWDIGRAIVERQRAEGWGKSVVDRAATDLQSEFPGAGGFSPQNVWKMRQFFSEYADLSQPVREIEPPPALLDIPWGHNTEIMFKVKLPEARLWYARAAKGHGWSRAVLVHQIETDLYRRKGKAVSNFDKTLPAATSDLARETLKDPFTFQFLTLAADHAEAELEKGLVAHIQKFLLELGVGFSFVGSQYHLDIGGEDFYLDLLFYHFRLRCFIVFDLKAKAFTPEAVGKMNFYCSVVDDLLRHETDHKTIGIVLCKSKSNLVAEYSLRDIDKPLAISTYVTKLLESIPEAMQKELGPPPSEPKKPAAKPP